MYRIRGRSRDAVVRGSLIRFRRMRSPFRTTLFERSPVLITDHGSRITDLSQDALCGEEEIARSERFTSLIVLARKTLSNGRKRATISRNVIL